MKMIKHLCIQQVFLSKPEDEFHINIGMRRKEVNYERVH